MSRPPQSRAAGCPGLARGLRLVGRLGFAAVLGLTAAAAPAAAREPPSLLGILHSERLAAGDLAAGAPMDWTGQPAAMAMPFLLPHHPQATADPRLLALLGSGLLRVAGHDAGAPSGIHDIVTAFLLQPRLAGFRGFPLRPPEAAPDDTLDGVVEGLADLVLALDAAAERVAGSWRSCSPASIERALAVRDAPRQLQSAAIDWARVEDLARCGDDRDRALALLQVVAATRRFEQAARSEERAAHEFGVWEMTTRWGRIVVADGTDHRHACADDCWLIVDLGGDDSYHGDAGAARFPRRPTALVIDLDGDDTYDAAGAAAAQGAGLGAVGMVFDARGDDRYVARDQAQGYGLLGYGVLWDRDGGDHYEAGGGAQGSALFGGGLLIDEAGHDGYRVDGEGQGFGGPGACGALVDTAGDDTYDAEPDPAKAGRADYHSQGRVASNLAQGAGVGRRGDLEDGRTWAGGVGVLADLEGNDQYRGGNSVQGFGYWFGTGMLLDAAGDDRYASVYFSQGSGAHYSLALLLDSGGDDRHELSGEAAASLGYGWDYAVSLFVDGGGRDRYRARRTVMGAAELRSIALFLELGGDDSYQVDDQGAAFGHVDQSRWGQSTATVELDAAPQDGGVKAAALSNQLAVFLDLGGSDEYPGGAEASVGNKRRWRRGGAPNATMVQDSGVGLDLDEPPPRDAAGWLLRPLEKSR